MSEHIEAPAVSVAPVRTAYAASYDDLIAHKEAVLQEQQILTELQQLRKAAVKKAIANGMTEVDAARLSGVHRHTVRDWLGKRKH